MPEKKIVLRGARVHNLKNINLTLPRDKLIVITGLSGSGKSSLAFDTIHAEGQRRYLESLSSYVRQFIGQMKKPDIDHIEGLSPTVAITQKTNSQNPRSTVGTLTEIYDYMRLLWARVGIPHCPQCGKVIESQSVDQIVDSILEAWDDQKIQILAPIAKQKKGEYKNIFSSLRKKGFVRVFVDGTMYDLDEDIQLKKTHKHDIWVVVDRLKVNAEDRSRITDSVEQALSLGDHVLDIMYENEKEKWELKTFSETFACIDCNISLPEIEPRLFSFNNPSGACPACSGLGVVKEVDPSLVIPDPGLSIAEGAIFVPGFRNTNDSYTLHKISRFLQMHGESKNTPFQKLPADIQHAILYGQGRFEGVIPMIERRHRETYSESSRLEYEKLMITRVCSSCNGSRLKPEALSVTIQEKNIHEASDLSIRNLLSYMESLRFSPSKQIIASRILKEITERLKFILNVGLEYLSLSRSSASLSGGEAQRLRLASQVGSGLMGVLYILDEPSIGLHSKDNEKLLDTLVKLRDTGNTVIVVEHDEETIRKADYIVDMGPFAGVHGGEVVAEGSIEKVMKSEKSLTAKYLKGESFIPLPSKRRKSNGKTIELKGVSEHNLQNVSVSFPLGTFICITGVSGSGKSTLINDVLYKAIKYETGSHNVIPGKYKKLEGLENIQKCMLVDQNPIGRTPRSNPATYVNLWTDIRKIFAALPESKIRGYDQGRFSFNVRGGRCESCKGDGLVKVEMQFLPDVYVPCEVCKGKRFNRETLEIEYRGVNIHDVLEMTVNESLELFSAYPQALRKLSLLQNVGLGYIKLGQSSTTLSGGEAQRIKLALELSKRTMGHTLYILDEPTTGLHFEDIKMLLHVLHQLVDKGNSIIIIEHNLDVIKCSDYIIDLGPGGGEFGGNIIVQGSPEDVVKHPTSYTGSYLQPLLQK
ncbi:MAG TPA: excinuclease ABC subunit UvrA [Caldisericia bacterium]|nr:excinuclease ABC subunit UvrA [Caldisericia bacterium]